MKTLGWTVFIFFAIVVGLYPLVYLIFDMSQGLLSSKTADIKDSIVWQSAFYTHILPGGIALLAGWSQFSKRIRNRNLKLHRTLGKIYLIAVLVSGTAGLYIAFYASGGWIAGTGFGGLAIAWLFTTVKAYVSVRNKQIDSHQYWMIRSYAVCFAAVTLRIWLPMFQFGFGMEFFFAYRIIAWLCWVPNLIVAEIIVRSLMASKNKARPVIA